MSDAVNAAVGEAVAEPRGDEVPPRPAFVLDLARCIGCWGCAIACKAKNGLADDAFWIRVETVGGVERDTSSGTFPDVSKHYRPDVHSCTYTAADLAVGEVPSCVAACPVDVFTFGDGADPADPITEAIAAADTVRGAVQPRRRGAPEIYYRPARPPERQRRSGGRSPGLEPGP
jgi:molybdopterin-containing oxidoreductase family iron-sulfur binding subunit